MKERTMLDMRIILSATWVVVTLIYLYGDVFRIYSGDFAKMANMNFNQFVWLGIAILMLTPILMVFLSLILPQSVSRWVNIIMAVFFLLFNLVGLPSYPSLYDKFLLAVSIIFNGVTVWYAWNWSWGV
jgi:hypothetical protein